MVAWFSSDQHHGHKNVVHIGKGRPFADHVEMSEEIVSRHNAVVAPEDHVYHLGDFSFGTPAKTIPIMERLAGFNHYLRGNHDGKTLDKVYRDRPDLFASYGQYKEIKVGERRLVLFHFPILSWHQMHKGSWHLHGHCHQNLTFDNGPMLDVGVDGFNFTPVSFEQVEGLLKDRELRLWDHHEEGQD
jgi:calcineurin-like phosphoesterase family protein